MMRNIREFASGWGDDYPLSWTNRVQEDLVGTAKGHLFIPCSRPFDHLTAPNERLFFLTCASNRVAVEANRGLDAYFHRNVDFDELYFQWAGETHYQTEYGAFTSTPSEVVLIPSGVAYRATGSADSLRVVMQVRDPIDALLTGDNHFGHTEYKVRWDGGPDWPVERVGPAPMTGPVSESIHTWDDEPGDETLVARDVERMLSVSSGGRQITRVRLFDLFEVVTGGGTPGPVPFKNDRFLVECYNTKGEQGAFHRGNRNEEFQFQFFGTAENICEFGTDMMKPGDLSVIRRGIGHRVIGSPDFRRLVLYSADPWKFHLDPAKAARDTSFVVSETVVDEASWRTQGAA